MFSMNDEFKKLWQHEFRRHHAGGALFFKEDKPVARKELITFSQKFGYELLTQKFSENRTDEFLLGRWCAHKALDEFMGESLQGSIAIGDDRSPQWPEGVVGSISHNEDVVVSLCAMGAKGIGVDIESRGRLNERLSEKILIDEDRIFLKTKSINSWSKEDFYTFIFSAKESLYKALYPTVKSFFGFSEAYISDLNFEQRSFVIKIHEESFLLELGLPLSFSGYFLEDKENILTFILWK